jgi:hypothetical protein
MGGAIGGVVGQCDAAFIGSEFASEWWRFLNHHCLFYDEEFVLLDKNLNSLINKE